MNYRMLRDEIAVQKFSQEDFARELGVSASGLKNMLRTESMKVSVLERSAELLQKDPCAFLDRKTRAIDIAAEPAEPYGDKLQQSLERNNALLEKILEVLKSDRSMQ